MWISQNAKSMCWKYSQIAIEMLFIAACVYRGMRATVSLCNILHVSYMQFRKWIKAVFSHHMNALPGHPADRHGTRRAGSPLHNVIVVWVAQFSDADIAHFNQVRVSHQAVPAGKSSNETKNEIIVTLHGVMVCMRKGKRAHSPAGFSGKFFEKIVSLLSDALSRCSRAYDFLNCVLNVFEHDVIECFVIFFFYTMLTYSQLFILGVYVLLCTCIVCERR